MNIGKNTVVTLEYSATDIDGNMIDEGKDPLTYLHGGYEEIFLPVEVALEGKTVGDAVTVKVQPAMAFGEYDTELIQIVPVEELPQPLAVGMQIEGSTENESFFATVTDIADGKAVVDANHPLAGVALVFNCTVLEVRRATIEEIETAMGGDGLAGGGAAQQRQ